MKEKNEPTKIVKGGFRATLALIFSIVTIFRTTNPIAYQNEIKKLKENWRK